MHPTGKMIFCQGFLIQALILGFALVHPSLCLSQQIKLMNTKRPSKMIVRYRGDLVLCHLLGYGNNLHTCFEDQVEGVERPYEG